MGARRIAISSVGITAFTFALFISGNALVAAQNPTDIRPELQKVHEALDKYQDPVMAVHDGYFSTLGCVEYPKPGRRDKRRIGPGEWEYTFSTSI